MISRKARSLSSPMRTISSALKPEPNMSGMQSALTWPKLDAKDS